MKIQNGDVTVSNNTDGTCAVIEGTWIDLGVSREHVRLELTAKQACKVIKQLAELIAFKTQ